MSDHPHDGCCSGYSQNLEDYLVTRRQFLNRVGMGLGALGLASLLGPSELVAAVTGKVREVGYDPILYGNYLLIHGQGEHRTYMYAHMKNPPSVHQGERVWAGERVGEVGETGNARTVGCQLHIEIHVNGVPIDPKPEVERWDAES